MQNKRMTLTLLIMVSLSGCANVKYGDKETEAKLQELRPIPGKTSLYVCRENALLVAAGNRTTVMVDNQPIGTLKPNNFAHKVIDPGMHEIYVKRNPGGNSGVLSINSKAEEVSIIWVGLPGAGLFTGALTVDFFPSRSEAEQCVKSAEYAIRADQ